MGKDVISLSGCSTTGSMPAWIRIWFQIAWRSEKVRRRELQNENYCR
jgi:hypothetical protein